MSIRQLQRFLKKGIFSAFKQSNVTLFLNEIKKFLYLKTVYFDFFIITLGVSTTTSSFGIECSFDKKIITVDLPERSFINLYEIIADD